MRTKMTALALTGAVAVGSGAYALGSQADDGSAQAARGSGAQQAAAGFAGGPGRGHGFFDLDETAEALGVEASALRQALEDLREEAPDHDDMRQELATALAGKLGVEASKVQEALEALHPAPGDRHADFAAALAKELGMAATKVESALEKVHERGSARRGPARLTRATWRISSASPRTRCRLRWTSCVPRWRPSTTSGAPTSPRRSRSAWTSRPPRWRRCSGRCRPSGTGAREHRHPLGVVGSRIRRDRRSDRVSVSGASIRIRDLGPAACDDAGRACPALTQAPVCPRRFAPLILP
jgi:hypothetical protein